MIYFLCPDYDTPSGGIRKLYRQVDILNGAGIPSAVLHHQAPFRCAWFEHDTPVHYVKETGLTPEDVAVIPEIFGQRILRMFPGVPKVILNQNTYNTFKTYPAGYEGAYPYAEALGVIVVSDDNYEYVKHAFPEAKVHRMVYAIDPDLFFLEEPKRNQACYMPRKNEEDAQQVRHVLRARGVELEFEVIDGLSETETAAVLRQSRFYLSFGHPEGFGLPPAEAMACGCIVVGYHGMGGSEFLRVPYAYPIEFGDVVSFAGTVEALMGEELSGQARMASAFIRETYSPERERESVVAAWQGILGARG